nr:MAG TPA: hypothetical protein [Inoviridae sp.]
MICIAALINLFEIVYLFYLIIIDLFEEKE